MRNNFAALILSHGRPDKNVTYDSLKKSGYTGKIYIIIDNTDSKAEEYISRYGDDVIIFDKKAEAQKRDFDKLDNFGDLRCVVFARNKCHEIASDLGIEYFIELDDDYSGFYFAFSDDFQQKKDTRIKNLDEIFDAMCDFVGNTNTTSIAMAQGGDFIGGIKNSSQMVTKKYSRKVMNTFVCKTSRPFKFPGSINEDTNAYVSLGATGTLFFTTALLKVNQKTTQQNSGGLTDIYLHNGTYVKSFYTVMMAPSCCKIKMMGEKHKRLHHNIKWRNAVPQIVPEKYKK